MSIAAWLMLLVGPLAKQALTALGFGIVVFVGVDAAVNAALSQAQAYWGGGSAVVIQYMAMAGINTAFGIIAGGVTARVSMMMLKRFIPK